MSLCTLPVPEARPARQPVAWPKPNAAQWLLFVGLALRLGHYFWNHTIWFDEAVLLTNILGKSYSQLTGPLDYEVAAPPLFLWGLRTMALLCGDHAYVWRLPPFLLSCLTLVLMAVLARRTLRPAPAALLIGLVAFSDAFIWLGCNVKPYILDAFLAAGIIYAYVETSDWTTTRRILLFMPAAPLLLCLSYPAVFMYAGLFLAFLPALVRERRAGVWAAYLALAAIVLATMAGLYFGPIRAQRVPGLMAGWMNKFPNSASPGGVPGWVVGNTFLVFHYCYNPVGAICVLVAGLGAWRCVRNRRFDWVCVCLGPVLACLLAAFLHAYPYSNNRLILFAAPGIGLMTGVGLSALLDKARQARWAVTVMAAVLIVPEVGSCLLHLHTPWRYPEAAASARFINERRAPNDLVASDGGTYSYFFFGELCSVAQAGAVPRPAGQRVWVVMDDYSPPGVEWRRPYVLERMPASDWELRSATTFQGADVYLFVRRCPVAALPVGAGATTSARE